MKEKSCKKVFSYCVVNVDGRFARPSPSLNVVSFMARQWCLLQPVRGEIAMVDDQDLPTKFEFRLIRSFVPGLGGRGEALLWMTIAGALEALSHRKGRRRSLFDWACGAQWKSSERRAAFADLVENRKRNHVRKSLSCCC
jgi:hypothetical protein